MKKQLAIALLCAWATTLLAQSLGPEVTSWILNTNGATGYAGISSNVQQVQYSANNVYVSATCIPGYDIGPWAGNPNTPANQNFVFKITRHPQPNTGTLIATPLGHIGVWSNGVSVFNAKDGMSWQNKGIWNRNAIIAEGPSFDNCLGHPAPNGEYHHHLNPGCLYDDGDKSQHSPLIGFAFDGYPIYGAYGFTNPNGTGGIKRMLSSWRKRDITVRETLANGTQLTAAQYGPAVSTTYPLGLYLEDFEYVAGLGDLDVHNGRMCVTPDYPDSTYAYFVTLDETRAAVFPYIIGPTYYGTVQAGNTGPQSGHNVPNEPVLNYTTAVRDISGEAFFDVFPNPAADFLALTKKTLDGTVWQVELLDANGRVRQSALLDDSAVQTLDLEDLTAGVYFLKIRTSAAQWARKVVVAR